MYAIRSYYAEGDVDWLPYISLNNRDKFWDFMNKGETERAQEFRDIIAKAYLEKANAVWLTNSYNFV